MAGKARVKINGGMPKKNNFVKGAIKRPAAKGAAAAGPLAKLDQQTKFAQMLKGANK